MIRNMSPDLLQIWPWDHDGDARWSRVVSVTVSVTVTVLPFTDRHRIGRRACGRDVTVCVRHAVGVRRGTFVVRQRRRCEGVIVARFDVRRVVKDEIPRLGEFRGHSL